MKIFSIRYVSTLLFLLTFVFVSVNSHSTIFAQSMAQAPIGGGSTTPVNNSSDSGNSNDTVYIVGAIAFAAVVGYIIYDKFYREKDDNDSTKTKKNSEFNQLLGQQLKTTSGKIKKVENAIPVNLYFGVKQKTFAMKDNTYSVGLAFKF